MVRISFLIYCRGNLLNETLFFLFDRWKSPDNEFRKSEFKLTEIPTIVDYGTVSTFCFSNENVLRFRAVFN